MKAQKPTKGPETQPLAGYLRPCQKCGNKAMLLNSSKKKGYSVICKETWRCAQQIGWYSTEDEAIEAWNNQNRPGIRKAATK